MKSALKLTSGLRVHGECAECANDSLDCFPSRRRRLDSHNRRRLRGAEIYELWISLPFERSARAGGTSHLCRLAFRFFEGECSGCPSWEDINVVKLRSARHRVTVVVKLFQG